MKAIFELDLIVGGESNALAQDSACNNSDEVHILPYPIEGRKPIGLPKPYGIDDAFEDILTEACHILDDTARIIDDVRFIEQSIIPMV